MHSRERFWTHFSGTQNSTIWDSRSDCLFYFLPGVENNKFYQLSITCTFKTTAASMLQTLTYFLIWLNSWKDLLLTVRTPGLKPSQPFHNQYLVYTWQYFKIAGLQRLCSGAIPHNIIIILSHIQEHNPRWLIWCNLMPLDRITWENAVE